MTHPLYNGHGAPGQRPLSSHAGLWYERFFHRFDPAWKVDDTAKRDWIRTVEGTCGNAAALERSVLRLLALGETLGGTSRSFATDWSFVTGLGLPHPVENGFTWHPTLGVPYLCGAAVKGLVKAWIECWVDLPDEGRQQRLDAWFGKEVQAGGLVFFDAIPTNTPLLGADIMTPHMGKWYEQGGDIGNPTNQPDRVPADWHDPTPIPFLVVKKAVFLFTIAPRTSDAEAQVPLAFEALENALTWLGAGAKTATGYGHMAPEDEVLRGLRDRLEQERVVQSKQEQKAAMSPLEQEMQEMLDNRPNPNEPDYTTLFLALEQGRWSGDDAVAVANHIRGLMQTARKWKIESRRPNKDKDYKRTLKVIAYLERKG